MERLILLITLLSTFGFTNAALYQITFQLGDFTVYYVYNNETTATDKVALVRTDGTNIYFTSVTSSLTTQYTSCRRTSQERYIVGPSGCSDIDNPALSIQSSNCIPNEADVARRAALFPLTWWYPFTSKGCNVAGGENDPRLCVGPLLLTIYNRDTRIPFPDTGPTQKQLLMATGAYVASASGPGAASPVVMEVPLIFPRINVTTDCPGNFQQEYVKETLDPIRSTKNYLTFAGVENPDNRVLLYRSEFGSVNFQIVLGTSVAAGNNYTFTYFSTQIAGSVDGVYLQVNWIDLIDFDVPYMFFDDTDTYICNATLSIVETTNPYELEEIQILTPNDYMLNQLPRRFWRLGFCGAKFGRLDYTGNLYYPYCLAGDFCGGEVQYVTITTPHLPYYVPPDPTLPYQFNGENIWPEAGSFLDYGQDGVNGRVYIPRVDTVNGYVNRPFLLPALILNNNNPNERFVQCSKFGMFVAGAGQTYCSMALTQIPCDENHSIFNQRCYYKFSPTTETRYAVPLDQYAVACQRLHPLAEPLIETNVYTLAFLLQTFIKLKPDVNNYAYYRIPVFNSNLCRCYSSLTQTAIGTCDCYSITYPLDGKYIFPICSIPEEAFTHKYSDIDIGVQTAKLFKYGQEGPRNGGFMAICNCGGRGWCDSNCITPCCPTAEAILQAYEADEMNTLLTFMQACTENNRGSCSNLNPRCCACNEPYGPNACIIPDFAESYQFRNYPCACFSSKSEQSTYFQINLDVFPVESYTDIPCSGIRQGVCVISDSGPTGKCVCGLKPNLKTGVLEPAFDGQGCSCEIPIQPADGDSPNGIIVSQLCNSQGTCCPGGLRWDNPYQGDLASQACYKNGTALTGCSCDNGKGGKICTCPVPIDYSLNRFPQQITYGANTFTYIDLGERIFIAYVRITNCPIPYFVQATDFPGLNSTSFNCVWDSIHQLWECPSTASRRYVSIFGEDTLSCTVQTYTEMFQYCGQNDTVNQFAGAFPDIPSFRTNILSLYPQPATMARFGCISTKCYCNSDYGGVKCRSRVSSIRETVVTSSTDANVEVEIWAKRYCMETILLPTLYDPVSGGGFINKNDHYCQCNPISPIDATGRLARSVQEMTGVACQCALAVNPVTGDSEECAGLGTCVEPRMPWAWCAEDYRNYTLDPLYTPFRQTYDLPLQQVPMTVTRQSLFLVMSP